MRFAVATILLITSAPLFAQAEQPIAAASVDASDVGKIIIYRQGTIVGAALGCPVRYEGRELVELGRNKFAEWPVPAGEYVLTNKTSSVDVIVRPGQTRYVRCQIKSGMLTGRADLQVVDQATFQEHAEDYEQKAIAFTFGTSGHAMAK